MQQSEFDINEKNPYYNNYLYIKYIQIYTPRNREIQRFSGK